MSEITTQNNKPIIPIFFASDDNYVPFLAVTLQSLEQNADTNYHYDIKILNADNISGQAFSYKPLVTKPIYI